MKKLEKKSYSLQEILDSDDELPMECDEIPFIPAYQNDSRFQYLEELKNSTEDSRLVKERQLKYSNTNLVGYLNKRDTFCFKSLDYSTNKTTLLWFLNFLLLKDLQSNYKFLTTCLVPNNIDNWNVCY